MGSPRKRASANVYSPLDIVFFSRAILPYTQVTAQTVFRESTSTHGDAIKGAAVKARHLANLD